LKEETGHNLESQDFSEWRTWISYYETINANPATAGNIKPLRHDGRGERIEFPAEAGQEFTGFLPGGPFGRRHFDRFADRHGADAAPVAWPPRYCGWIGGRSIQS
jgi:hypothetical protein